MATWNAAFDAAPAGGSDPSQGDDRIREERAGISYRMSNEHNTYRDSTTGDPDLDWTHKAGSAKATFDTSAPTTRPNGVTALDSDDDGRLHIDTSDSGYILKVYDDAESGFMEVGKSHGGQIVTDAGTWVVPAGITTAYITGCAVGGYGSGVSTYTGAGGGGGEWVLKKSITVVPGETLTFTLGTHGANTTIVGSVSGALLTLNHGADASGITPGAGGTGGDGNSGGKGGDGADPYSVNGHAGFAAGGGGILTAVSTIGGGGGSYGGGCGGNLSGAAAAGYGGGAGGCATGATSTPGAAIIILEW